ncbi:MAG TPA: carbohydrate-binding family 9-like protein [Longimicrobiales bacterium]
MTSLLTGPGSRRVAPGTLVILVAAWSCGGAPAESADARSARERQGPATAGTAPGDVPVYESPRAPVPPVVDGVPDEAAWAAAPWTEPFVDIRGAGHPAPRHRTRARLLWDDAHLYVAAELEEPHLWGHITERDAIVYRDDDFEVFLDPDGDGLRYFEIEINVLGTVLDLYLDKPYRHGGQADIPWDIPGLRSAVRLVGTLNDPSDEDVGWTVEMAIPWADLVAPGGTGLGAPRAGDQWRVTFSRVEWPFRVADGTYVKTVTPTREVPHPEDNWVWSPTGEVNIHIPERWGVVRFVEPAARGGS